ncbi:hypothetical protein [Acinetobacter seifertii]|uniref:hypothetical protein n=1 Tax=Acinetobacter seifertii TaxID=1530123 RepID=UPI00168B70D9|nr:hypothetical protein [Acinetobacter seifertii]QNX86370.1 hypothetical protein IC772_12040 [Acinetobacter seifertii]
MKNLKILIAISLLIFLICLSTSIIIKHYFNIDGDYLSAFSTLVAALVAFYLFTDWKVEHKIKLIDQFHVNLRIKTSEARIVLFDSVIFKLEMINGSRVETGNQLFLEAVNGLDKFLLQLSGIYNYLLEYKVCLSSLDENSAVNFQNVRVEYFIKCILENFNNLTEIRNSVNDINSLSQKDLMDIKQLIISFENFVSLKNSEFYFNYLNSLK